MSLRQTLLSGGASFAHLAGMRRAAPVAARVEEGGEDPDKEKDDEEMKAALKEAEDRAAAAEKRADDAEEEMRRMKAEQNDDDDADTEGDDDKDREEMSRPKGNRIRAARSRERARCAAIFSDPAAANNPQLAAQLAFGADPLPRSAAVNLLRAGGPRSRLAERMAITPTPPVGSEPAKTTDTEPMAAAKSAVALYDQMRAGKKR